MTQERTDTPTRARAGEAVGRLLATVANHLGIDLVYLSRVTDRHQIVEAVSGDPSPFGLAVDTVIPLEETYCVRVLAGELAYLVPDTSADPITSALPVTVEAGIGAYVGVPIRHRDGRLHGTLCCASREPRTDLTWRDVRFMRVVARLIADEIAGVDDESGAEELPDLRRLIEEGELTVQYQPIIHLGDERVVGVEALTRFRDGTPPLPPHVTAASEAGREIERFGLVGALAALDDLPEPLHVSVNLSPATLLETPVEELLGSAPLRRVVLEISEHARVPDYEGLKDRLEPALDRGVRLAVDDVGSSLTGLTHVLELSPDVVKLDVALIRDLLDDENQRAVTEAILALAERMHADVVADGIETEEMRIDVEVLGIPLGQGYLLGRPSRLDRLPPPATRGGAPAG